MIAWAADVCGLRVAVLRAEHAWHVVVDVGPWKSTGEACTPTEAHRCAAAGLDSLGLSAAAATLRALRLPPDLAAIGWMPVPALPGDES